jgi:NAD-dependent SIR2 family protein deacetylase
LLNHLASDPTHCFTKHELLRDVWGGCSPCGKTGSAVTRGECETSGAEAGPEPRQGPRLATASSGRVGQTVGVPDLHAGSIVLLGAGASAEAGVPTTFEMTEKLVRRVGEQRRFAQATSALHFVCGALLAYDAAEGASPFSGLDVERVFSAVELLAERRTLEVTPFVSSWHPAVDALDQQRTGSVPGFFDRNLKRALLEDRGFDKAGRLITDLVKAVGPGTPTGATYTRLAGLMLDELRQLVATTAKNVNYLTPLVEMGRRPGGLTIATLNYDRAVEQAAASAQVPLDSGIERWVAEGRWTWRQDGIRLLKLHGSIDWVWESEKHVDGYLPRTGVTVTDNPAEDRRRPVLIFGQRGKLRAEGPFLSLLGEFESELSKADRLIVIGYSFRDEHVNELIRRWTSEAFDRKILVIDPAWPERFGGPDRDFRAQLDRHLVPPSWQDEPQFAPRIEVWRERCSEAVTKFGRSTPSTPLH